MQRTGSLAALILALGLVACAGQPSEKQDAKPAAGHETQAASGHESHDAKPAAGASAEMLPAVGTDVDMNGKTGCGHCTFSKTSSCAVMVQTADGTLYVLDGVGEDTELFSDRMGGKNVHVRGKVSGQRDGYPLVAMNSYEFVQ